MEITRIGPVTILWVTPSNLKSNNFPVFDNSFRWIKSVSLKKYYIKEKDTHHDVQSV
jgi:hypothetical protein